MNSRIISKEQLTNGNVVFSYKEHKFIDNKWVVFIPIIIAFAVLIWELTQMGTAYFQAICLPIVMYILYKRLQYTEKQDQAIELQVINESLAEIIKRDIKTFGESTKEITRKYILKEDEDGYTLKRRYLLVVLSNGAEITYDIINVKHYDNIVMMEIDTHFKLTKK